MNKQRTSENGRDQAGHLSDLMQRADETAHSVSGELAVFLDEIEALLKDVAHVGGAEMERLRQRLGQRLLSGREALARSRHARSRHVMGEKAESAARLADDYVHERPWSALGVAAVMGAILGFAISRR